MNHKQGEIIEFGTYPHSADGHDKTPVRWRVLQNSGHELFVLSELILDCRRYHDSPTGTTWQDSDIRSWLRDEFYPVAFSAREKDRIITTRCTDNGPNTPDTEDNIFLLSVAQVKTHSSAPDSPMSRHTTGTEFAKAKKSDGCCLYVYDKGVIDDYVIENGEKKGCSWWWTRTQLQDQHPSRATFIGPRGHIKSYGRIDIRHYGVRPAIKLNLR